MGYLRAGTLGIETTYGGKTSISSVLLQSKIHHAFQNIE